MLADQGLLDTDPRHSSATFPRRLMQEPTDNVFEEEEAPASCSGYSQHPLSPRSGPMPGIILTVEGEEGAAEVPAEASSACDRSSSAGSTRSSRRSRHQHHQAHAAPRSPSVSRMRRNASNHKLRESGMNGTGSCVSRSQSMRTARRPQSVDPSQRFRQRISSIPNDMTMPSDLLDPNRIASNQSLPLPGDESDILRLRNFAVTPKGVINRGDSFRSKSRSAHSVASLGSGHLPVQRVTSDDSRVTTANGAVGGVEEPPVEQVPPFPVAECASTSEIIPPKTVRYRVLVLGAPDVGKSSLTRQFMTSEYICAYDSSIDEDNEKNVTVILNGEESELTFIEHTYLEDTHCNFTDIYGPDAYLVVYSVTHKKSLQMARDIMRLIHKWDNHIERKALILVGNKMDLARLRMLTTDDGRSLAMEEGSKFIETSAGINHHVDELLVGILTQIRLKLSSAEKQLRKRESVSLSASGKGRPINKCAGCAGCKAKGIFKRILKKACNRSKSCDNLHVL